jgi:hypothetical protein
MWERLQPELKKVNNKIQAVNAIEKPSTLNAKYLDMNMYQALCRQWRSRKGTLLIATVILTVCTSAAVINSLDFSGEWKLNEQKSELGQFGGRGAAKSIKVTSSDAKGISIERTSTNQNGEAVVRKESLTFDGKESESTGGFGNSTRKASAKWADDGQSMIINAIMTFDRNGEKMEVKQNETWRLGDNGQTLTIESNSSSSFGESTMKLVYEKVKKA